MCLSACVLLNNSDKRVLNGSEHDFEWDYDDGNEQIDYDIYIF